MTKRNGRRVNQSTRSSSSKQNEQHSSAGTSSHNARSSSSRSRDCPSDEESERNVHGESEMTQTKTVVIREDNRRSRTSNRRQTTGQQSQQSSFVTLTALIVVHLVLTVSTVFICDSGCTGCCTPCVPGRLRSSLQVDLGNRTR